MVTGKLIVLTIIAIGLLIGLLFGLVAEEAWGLLGMIVGYLTANGQAAARGEISLPPILPRSHGRDSDR